LADIATTFCPKPWQLSVTEIGGGGGGGSGGGGGDGGSCRTTDKACMAAEILASWTWWVMKTITHAHSAVPTDHYIGLLTWQLCFNHQSVQSLACHFAIQTLACTNAANPSKRQEQ